MSIPAPGESLPAPGQMLPPPGQVAAPQPPPPDPTRDGAFSGGGGGFDPNDGIIDVGGDVPAKGSKGLVAFAAAGALVLGMLFGWVGKSTLGKSQQITRARAKGQTMATEVQAVADMRKDISLKMEDLKKQIAEDPKAGGEALKELNAANFEKHPKVDDLFGWQLASIHPKDVKKVFQLYEEANGLKTDLGYLAGFVTANAAALGKAGGPASFGVLFDDKGGMTLVETVAAMCKGEGDAPAPCPDGDNAIGYLVRDKLGSEPAFAPIGTGAGQISPINRSDEMYLYLVGQNPENNAKLVYGRLLAQVNTRLEEMNKVERRAINALKAYANDPDVDGSNPAEEAGDE
ncbi:MAG: hypothetical protein H6713_23140 [Myxococcales bacterium]|nr:hypothetical protein [Myxococcales bacterium]